MRHEGRRLQAGRVLDPPCATAQDSSFTRSPHVAANVVETGTLMTSMDSTGKIVDRGPWLPRRGRTHQGDCESVGCARLMAIGSHAVSRFRFGNRAAGRVGS